MAYDKVLEERVEDYLIANNIPYEIKHMFGGAAFMVDDKMCVGIIKENLMARVDSDIMENLLELDYANRMKMGQRTMKGYLSIHPDGLIDEDQLSFWIQKCLDFNPKAKKSKKRR